MMIIRTIYRFKLSYYITVCKNDNIKSKLKLLKKAIKLVPESFKTFKNKATELINII